MSTERIPGLNAPMTSGQKWALVWVALALLMNGLALFLLMTGRLGL